MTAGDGAEDRDKTQHEQDPVKSLDPREGILRSAPSARPEPAVKKQRLDAAAR
jgi:hypothetical protein